MSEQDLIRRARSGDDAAFTNLVEQYQTAVFNLCYRMLGNPQEAEDAAQEAFLRAYSQLASYDPARSFKTWLFSIAVHRVPSLPELTQPGERVEVAIAEVDLLELSFSARFLRRLDAAAV